MDTGMPVTCRSALPGGASRVRLAHGQARATPRRTSAVRRANATVNADGERTDTAGRLSLQVSVQVLWQDVMR
ncbi:hypothetical protein GCM10022214_64760 [Actinomadura miaoliensis]|uniref:Uncharacterized protein n=1 Tax=Actinomadura miaoliensis TaxID=430685 RepID=A0ABP7WPE3_9ACTN